MYQRVGQYDKEIKTAIVSSDDVLLMAASDHSPRVTARRSCWLLWLLHCALLAVNIIGLCLQQRRSSDRDSGTGYRPLEKLGQYKTEYWNMKFGEYSPYTDPKNPNVSTLWHEISAPPGKIGFVKVQKQDLDRVNLTSIAMADGSGYLATVDVFHQLHCLDMLRQLIFSPQETEHHHHEEVWQEHAAHCIDSIRQSLQCHADTSLLTFKWTKNLIAPWPDFRTYHTCRNFEDLKMWAQEHMIDAEVPGLFVHPPHGQIHGNNFTKIDNPLEQGEELEFLSN